MRRRKRVRDFLKVGIVGLACSLASGAANADVVAVISAASPVMEVSANELADIFLGRASRLPGGAVAVPIDQVEGSAARNAFYTALTGKSAAQLRAHWARLIFTGRGQPPREVANFAEAKKLLVENPNAIAYAETSEVDDTLRVLPAH